MGRAPNPGAPQRVSAHVLPKALPFSEVDEDEKTTIESGWEEEPSTTVEQGEVADRLRGLAAEQRHNNNITGVTSTSAIEESTVDDQHANVMSIVTPVTVPARILITQGNETGAELEIRPGKTYTIGRGVDNDIVLTDIAVSRKHFDLRFDGGAWLVIDRGSGNGTLVNGNLEDQPFMLASGDAIEIGNTTFRFEQMNGKPRPAEHLEEHDVDLSSAQHDRDDEEEPSTVAGKPMRPETSEPFAPQPPLRAKTLPPPSPPRNRSPSVGPAPMPPPPQYAVPSIASRPPRPATLMGQQEQQHMMQPLPNLMPTTLPGQGAPMPAHMHQPQMLGSQPQMMAYGYGQDMPAPYVVHNGQSSREAPATALVQPTPYGGMPAAPYVAQPVPSLSRRTKMILGSIALTAFAAIVTVAVIRSGPAPAAAPPDDKPVATKPTVETIQPPTVTPVPTIAPKAVVVDPPKKIDPPVAPPPQPKAVVKADPPPTVAPKKIEQQPPPPKQVVKNDPPPKKDPPPPPKQVVKNEPPPRKEPPPKKDPPPKRVAIADPPTPPTRTATDSSGAKSKAAQQFAAKQFNPAIATLKNAATTASPDDSKELLQLARIYDQFARNYNMGTGPATPATDAYTALMKARNFDSAGTFKTEIDAKLGDVAQRAAVTFMGKSSFIEAFGAVRTAESLSGATGTTKSIRSKLESQAADLYQSAVKEMPAESAKEKLKTIKGMVESKSQWYQKASKLLASA